MDSKPREIDLSEVVETVKSASDAELKVLSEISAKLNGRKAMAGGVRTSASQPAPRQPRRPRRVSAGRARNMAARARRGEVELNDIPQPQIIPTPPPAVSQTRPAVSEPPVMKVKEPSATRDAEFTAVPAARPAAERVNTPTAISSMMDTPEAAEAEPAQQTVNADFGDVAKMAGDAIDGAMKSFNDFWKDERGRLRRGDGKFASKAESAQYNQSAAAIAKEREKNQSGNNGQSEDKQGFFKAVGSLIGKGSNLLAQKSEDNEAAEAAGAAAGGSFFYAVKESYELAKEGASLVKVSNEKSKEGIKGVKAFAGSAKSLTAKFLGFGRTGDEPEKAEKTQTAEVANTANDAAPVADALPDAPKPDVLAQTKAQSEQKKERQILKERSDDQKKSMVKVIGLLEDIADRSRQSNDGLFDSILGGLGGLGAGKLLSRKGKGKAPKTPKTKAPKGGVFKSILRGGGKGIAALAAIAGIGIGADALTGGEPSKKGDTPDKKKPTDTPDKKPVDGKSTTKATTVTTGKDAEPVKDAKPADSQKPKDTPAKADTPKDAPAKAADAPKADTPKDAPAKTADTPKAKADTPKGDAPAKAADAPKADAPKGDAPAKAADAPKADTPKGDAPAKAADAAKDAPAKTKAPDVETPKASKVGKGGGKKALTMTGTAFKGASALSRGVGRFALPMLAPVLAAYDAYDGFTDADTQRAAFDLGEDEQASLGQKSALAAANVLDMGGLVSGGVGLLGAGLEKVGFDGAKEALNFDVADIAKGLFNLFGGKSKDEKDPEAQAADKAAPVSTETSAPSAQSANAPEGIEPQTNKLAEATAATAATGAAISDASTTLSDASATTAEANTTTATNVSEVSSNLTAASKETAISSVSLIAASSKLNEVATNLNESTSSQVTNAMPVFSAPLYGTFDGNQAPISPMFSPANAGKNPPAATTHDGVPTSIMRVSENNQSISQIHAAQSQKALSQSDRPQLVTLDQNSITALSTATTSSTSTSKAESKQTTNNHYTRVNAAPTNNVGSIPMNFSDRALQRQSADLE